MEISPLQRKISAADIPLEKMAGATGVSEQEKIAEISRQFEAVLVRQILSEGLKPQFGPDKKQSSSTSDIYRDMITNQMADRISHSGGLGLANSLQTQLSRQTLHSAGTGPAAGAAQAKGNALTTKGK